MIQMRVVNAVEIVLTQRLAEIEAEHFGADGAVERADLDVPSRVNMASNAGGGRCKGGRHRTLVVESGRKTPARAQSDEFTGARARRQRSKSDTDICWSDKADALTHSGREATTGTACGRPSPRTCAGVRHGRPARFTQLQSCPCAV
jgi:hypothetical protein